MSVFANIKRYEEGYTVVSQEEVGFEDRKIFKSQVRCDKSAYGRTFWFFAWDGYRQPINVNPKSRAEIGKFYDISEIIIQTLTRNGETIYRGMLKSDLNL